MKIQTPSPALYKVRKKKNNQTTKTANHIVTFIIEHVMPSWGLSSYSLHY